jgi:tetratricopeptide (TPR) repeat protein
VPISAELVYLFRHTVVRDAAYQLQLPSGRAKLHALAFEVMDMIFGHEEPGPIVFELVAHAQAALALPGELTAERAKQISDRETDLLQVASTVAKNLNLHGQCAGYLERVLLKDLDPAGKVGVYIKYSEALNKTGSGPRAMQAARDAVSLARAHGLRDLLGSALSAQGASLIAVSQYEEGRPALEEAASLAAESGNAKLEGATLGYLAVSAWRQGARGQAEDLFAKALSALRVSGDTKTLAQHLGNYGLLQAESGRHERALEVYTEAGKLHRDVGNDWSGAVVMYNSCISQEKLGRDAAARVSLKEARLQAERVGHRRLHAAILGRAASFDTEDGRFADALPLFAEAAQTARELHDPATENSVRGNYGLLLDMLGMAREAERELGLARALALQANDSASLVRLEGNLAGIFNAWGRHDQAVELATEAMVRAQRVGKPDLVVQFGLHKANSLLKLGRFDESVAVLDAIESQTSTDSAHASFIALARAYFALLLGRLEESESLLAQVKHKAAIVRYLSESEVQIALRLAIARGQRERAEAALDELAAAKPDVSAWPNARHTLRRASMRRLLAEFNERGSRRLWFGHFPEDLGVELRKALLERATPEFLRQCDAELLAAMAAP